MDGTFDLKLVLASWCVSAIAAYAAFDLGGRIPFFDGLRERLWLCASALAMGSGIWAAHFLDLQALGLPLPLSFDLRLSLLSWLAAVLPSLLALYLVSRNPVGTAGLAGGGVAMGLGICLMHYTGIYALRLTPHLAYHSELFSASMFLAVGLSIAALSTGFSVRRLPLQQFVPTRLVGALLMGTAICGTHCIGLLAAKFPASLTAVPGNQLSGKEAWLLVALISVSMVLLVTLLSMLNGRKLAARRRIEWQRLGGPFPRELASG